VFAGAAVGALAGARWMEKVPEHWLAAVFALVLGTAAVRMWF